MNMSHACHCNLTSYLHSLKQTTYDTYDDDALSNMACAAVNLKKMDLHGPLEFELILIYFAGYPV